MYVRFVVLLFLIVVLQPLKSPERQEPSFLNTKMASFDIEVKLQFCIILLYSEGQSLNSDWNLDPDLPFGKSDKGKFKPSVLLGFCLNLISALDSIYCATSQNPWNDIQVTFKVVYTFLNTLREYFVQPMFRQSTLYMKLQSLIHLAF